MNVIGRIGFWSAALLAAAGGCSTITRGPTQTVTFQADAADATIYLGREAMRAPARVELSRSQTYVVMVTAPGRRSVQFELEARFDGISLGNLIYPGGSVGLLTDFITGSDKTFHPIPMIQLPRIDAKTKGEPAMVFLHQHQGQLLTKQEEEQEDRE